MPHLLASDETPQKTSQKKSEEIPRSMRLFSAQMTTATVESMGKGLLIPFPREFFSEMGNHEALFGEIRVLERFSLLTKKESHFLYKKIVDFMMKVSEVISIKTNLIRFIFEFETFLFSCSKEKM